MSKGSPKGRRPAQGPVLGRPQGDHGPPPTPWIALAGHRTQFFKGGPGAREA